MLHLTLYLYVIFDENILNTFSKKLAKQKLQKCDNAVFSSQTDD